MGNSLSFSRRSGSSDRVSGQCAVCPGAEGEKGGGAKKGRGQKEGEEKKSKKAKMKGKEEKETEKEGGDVLKRTIAKFLARTGSSACSKTEHQLDRGQGADSKMAPSDVLGGDRLQAAAPVSDAATQASLTSFNIRRKEVPGSAMSIRSEVMGGSDGNGDSSEETDENRAETTTRTGMDTCNTSSTCPVSRTTCSNSPRSAKSTTRSSPPNNTCSTAHGKRTAADKDHGRTPAEILLAPFPSHLLAASLTEALASPPVSAQKPDPAREASKNKARLVPESKEDPNPPRPITRRAHHHPAHLNIRPAAISHRLSPADDSLPTRLLRHVDELDVLRLHTWRRASGALTPATDPQTTTTPTPPPPSDTEDPRRHRRVRFFTGHLPAGRPPRITLTAAPAQPREQTRVHRDRGLTDRGRLAVEAAHYRATRAGRKALRRSEREAIAARRGGRLLEALVRRAGGGGGGPAVVAAAEEVVRRVAWEEGWRMFVMGWAWVVEEDGRGGRWVDIDERAGW